MGFGWPIVIMQARTRGTGAGSGEEMAHGWRDPELLAADFVGDDRRAVVGGGVSSRDEYVELWSGEHVAPGYDLTLETLATRGDVLVLYRLKMFNDGVMTEFLQIDRWFDDGLMDRQVRVDPADLDGAMVELDRLWFASLNDRQQAVSALAVALGQAWVAPSTPLRDATTSCLPRDPPR